NMEPEVTTRQSEDFIIWIIMLNLSGICHHTSMLVIILCFLLIRMATIFIFMMEDKRINFLMVNYMREVIRTLRSNTHLKPVVFSKLYLTPYRRFMHYLIYPERVAELEVLDKSF